MNHQINFERQYYAAKSITEILNQKGIFQENSF